MNSLTAHRHPVFRLPTPFDIPEILDRILSFVDKRTLHSAFLVERQWLQLGRQYNVFEYAWSDARRKDYTDLVRAMYRLPWISRLQWHAAPRMDTFDDSVQADQWFWLLAALEHLGYGQVERETAYDQADESWMYRYQRWWEDEAIDFSTYQANPLTRGPRVNLQEFELKGHTDVPKFRLILPLLSTVTKLRFVNVGGDGTRHQTDLQMGLIMQHCPLLEYLYISSTEPDGEQLPGPWNFATTDTSPASSTPPHPPIVTLPLKSLVLNNAMFYQHDLEDFLAFTPHLKTLKVIKANLLGPPPQFLRIPLNTARFSQVLNNLPLCLSVLHISTKKYSYNDLPTRFCPNSQERSFVASDFTAPLLRTLRQQPNTLTSLELLHNGNCSSTLHDFLCNSHHLIHLKAPMTLYSVEHMDLHGRLLNAPYPGRNRPPTKAGVSPPTPPPGIWKCRNLRTLHVSIITPDTSSRRKRSGPCPEFSRIAFGYISRVCPQLRDLMLLDELSPEYPTLDMRLQGGFCLLGRLKHLEKLKIGEWRRLDNLTTRNFEWFIAAGRTEALKAERQAASKEGWRRFLDTDGDLAPHRIAKAKAKTKADATKLTALAEPAAPADPTTPANPATPAAEAAEVEGGGGENEDPVQRKMHFDWTDVDPGLKEDLKYLGLAHEIKVIFDEVDQRGPPQVPFFSALRYATICSPSRLELPPEREYKRLVVTRTQVPW
ncbi:hypothetical protein KI688_000654 [Linnemannia hyalina]|uniref:F-box domain-containing protein n=1 Tax=Linnemannia hyalina TaxID=64524 RepID=A0A9P7Y5V1_9FUNG|nr:hypothetical protein KI688_000654 [Linnemannia hyalina]